MDFKVEEIPVSLSCHPQANLVIIGCLDGSVILKKFSVENGEMKFSTGFRKQHKTPVRKIRFSTAGDQIFSLTRNKTLTCWDSSTGKKARVIRRITDANARPYCMYVINEHQLAVGDEAGVVRVFDWRCKNDPPLATKVIDSETDQYLTDIITNADGKLLLTTCGDCTLLAIDLRKKKTVMKSEPMHDELLCLTAAKNETKLFCGSADGFLEEFNFGEWGNLVERFDTKHDDTVDSLCKLDEDLLASASANGTIRLHNILPNRTLKIIGRHDEPIEELALSKASTENAQFLVSCGHDSKVKFWNLDDLKRTLPSKTKSGAILKKMTKNTNRNNFFDDLDTAVDSAEDESGSDDDENDSKNENSENNSESDCDVESDD